MPQEFQILRCCECEKFQVHHMKKAKKWQCKVCGEKQSLKRAFFIGSSRDCRINVQELNFQAGEQRMLRKLDESGNSADMHNKNGSLELVKEDSDFPTEHDWVDENDGIDDNNWADENEWIDEDDGFDEDPSNIFESPFNENLQNNMGNELPRKKQRCESFSESGAVKEKANFIQLPEEIVETQSNWFSPPVFKSMKDMVPSQSIELTNENSSTKVVLKTESKQECVSIKENEGSSLTESANSKSNSILTPTPGFQLILNEARKRRTHFSFDVDL